MSEGVRVRPARPDDRAAWLRMRAALWPDGTVEEHAGEIDAYLAGDAEEPLVALLAFADDDATPIGFAELSIRPCAEGCRTQRVGYLEGWFVDAAHRGHGVGASLVRAAEDWARAQGCTEFASDSEVDNEDSRRAHLAVGFEEVGVVRCYRKRL